MYPLQIVAVGTCVRVANYEYTSRTIGLPRRSPRSLGNQYVWSSRHWKRLRFIAALQRKHGNLHINLRHPTNK